MKKKRASNFHEAVLDLATAVDLLIHKLNGLPMPADIQNLRAGFRDNYAKFCALVDDGVSDGGESGLATSIMQTGQTAAKLAELILKDERITPDAQQHAHAVIQKAEAIAFKAQTGSIFYKPLQSITDGDPDSSEGVAHEARKRELERQYDLLRGEISSAEVKLKELQSQGDDLAIRIGEQLSKATQLYTDGKQTIEAARSDFNELIGVATGEVLDGDYSKSAKREKWAAEWTRAVALILMSFVAGGLLYLLFHENIDTMTWQMVVTRLFLALALSVPAGYLARESVRHRSQQHSYLQTSLNLQAITPFIASLPAEQQHALKTTMAERLFSNHSVAHGTADLGLINAHEIVMQLIKQLGIKQRYN